MILRLGPAGVSGLGQTRLLRLWPFLIPFIVLATLNAGGYRYGASDQAFYLPAILKQLDPELFPRDTAVLSAQTQLTVVDEAIALIASTTGASLPVIFVVLFVAALTLLAWGAWLLGRRVYRSQWTAVALLAALTLRHGIARSGTNTLEGYFHPRVLAFALGTLALVAFLERRFVALAGVLLVALAVHPTTALWFILWLGAAFALAEPALRKWVVFAGLVGAVGATWLLTLGPLAGHLRLMDPEWRNLLAAKDYLFPFGWPAYAWVLNLGYLPVIAWLFLRRTSEGLMNERERTLVLGSFVLVLVFVGALVCQTVGVALAFQLQPARVFWMFDFIAITYAVWGAAEAGTPNAGAIPLGTHRRAAVIAALVASFSIGRGLYVIYQTDRPPFRLAIADDDWGRVMRWAQTTDKRTGWLADPMHSFRYGSSVRVAGHRDVFVEAVKDAAIGMYDRDVAMRTDQRIRAIDLFDQMSRRQVMELAQHYDLDYLVTEQTLEMPLAFESGALRVYRLK